MNVAARRMGYVGMVMLVVAMLAGPARASVLIGEPQPFASGSNTVNCTSCQFMLLTPPTGSTSVQMQAPFSGVITRWRVRAMSTWTLTTMRPVLGNTKAEVIRKGSSIALPTSGFSDGEAATRTPISEQDYIGVQSSTGSSSAAIDGKSTTPGAQSGFLGSALAEGASATVTTVANRYDLNADLEPDADTDGYGDETQDQCPTDRTTQGPCPVTAPVQVSVPGPTVTVPGPTVSVPGPTVTSPRQSDPSLSGAKTALATNGKSISVTFACPADRTSACSGVVRAQTRTAVLGSGGFSGGPGASMSAKIALGHAGKKLFAHGKRQSVTLIAEPSDGAASTLSAKLSGPKPKHSKR
jgi:hypothetical protein